MPISQRVRDLVPQLESLFKFELVYELDNGVALTYELGGLIPQKYAAKRPGYASKMKSDLESGELKPPGQGICFAMVYAWIKNYYVSQSAEGRQWYDGKIEALKEVQRSYEYRYWRRFYRRDVVRQELAAKPDADVDVLVGRFNRNQLQAAGKKTAGEAFGLERSATEFADVNTPELMVYVMSGRPSHWDLQMAAGGHAIGVLWDKGAGAKKIYLLDPNLGLMRWADSEFTSFQTFVDAWLDLNGVKTVTVFEVPPPQMAAAAAI